MTQMKIATEKKQTHGYGEHTCGCGGTGRKWVGVGIGGQQMQALASGVEKQWDPPV